MFIFNLLLLVSVRFAWFGFSGWSSHFFWVAKNTSVLCVHYTLCTVHNHLLLLTVPFKLERLRCVLCFLCYSDSLKIIASCHWTTSGREKLFLRSLKTKHKSNCVEEKGFILHTHFEHLLKIKRIHTKTKTNNDNLNHCNMIYILWYSNQSLGH